MIDATNRFGWNGPCGDFSTPTSIELLLECCERPLRLIRGDFERGIDTLGDIDRLR